MGSVAERLGGGLTTATPIICARFHIHHVRSLLRDFWFYGYLSFFVIITHCSLIHNQEFPNNNIFQQYNNVVDY